MQQRTPLDHAARVLSETDPARRYHAAKAAAEAVAAPYEQAAEEAVEELIAQHGGNVAAAARELGLTRQALYMRKKRTDPPAAAPAAAGQVQPALRFTDARHARTVLIGWQLRQQEITDQLDALLLGALAAGVDPVQISEDTGVGLDTLRRIRPAGNIEITPLEEFSPELEEFARAVHAHARDLTGRAASRPERTAAAVWRDAAEAILSNVAPLALLGEPSVRAEDYPTWEEYVAAVETHEPTEEEKAAEGRQERQSELAATDGPDAWLAATYLAFRRSAAREGYESDADDPEAAATTDAIRAAFGEVADAILHLRTTGQVPPSLTDSSGSPR